MNCLKRTLILSGYAAFGCTSILHSMHGDAWVLFTNTEIEQEGSMAALKRFCLDDLNETKSCLAGLCH